MREIRCDAVSMEGSPTAMVFHSKSSRKAVKEGKEGKKERRKYFVEDKKILCNLSNQCIM